MTQATWRMDYQRSCNWASNTVNDVTLESLKCVRDKGASEGTCAECPFRKV